jgi:hypothetical protein
MPSAAINGTALRPIQMAATANTAFINTTPFLVGPILIGQSAVGNVLVKRIADVLLAMTEHSDSHCMVPTTEI